MTFVAPGTTTFQAEVTHISGNGFWILLDDAEELLLPFDEFPWFRDAPVGKILHLERPSRNHRYWPELDIDLSVESIRHSQSGSHRTLSREGWPETGEPAGDGRCLRRPLRAHRTQ